MIDRRCRCRRPVACEFASRLVRAPQPCAPPSPRPFPSPDAGAGARPAAAAPSATCERMTSVTRTPLSASMRETSNALSPPPITATCVPKSASGSPNAVGPRWTRPAAASCRAFSTWSSHSSPRNSVPVAITRAGPDKDSSAWPGQATSSRKPSPLRRRRCGRLPSQVSTASLPTWPANVAAFWRALWSGCPSSHSLG